MSSESKCPMMWMSAAAATVAAVGAWLYSRSKTACKKKHSRRFPCLCDTGKEWFAEVSDEMWPGQAMSLSIKKVIYQGKSKYQDIAVFDSEEYGRVLTLDGAIQLTTRDEHAYQETLAHTPMQLVEKAERVLVIGGGDGGVLRELARYPNLKELHICELDEEVINVSKKYIKQTSVGFEDPRVRVHIEDGFTFLERSAKNGDLFDVIISDLSDPVGPAEAIFTSGFMELINRALKPNGAAVMQAECMWIHGELIKKLMKSAKAIFQDAQYASITIPTYPCGQIGALVMTKNPKVKVNVPVHTPAADILDQLKYYTPELHTAQFVLPKFAQELI